MKNVKKKFKSEDTAKTVSIEEMEIPVDDKDNIAKILKKIFD